MTEHNQLNLPESPSDPEGDWRDMVLKVRQRIAAELGDRRLPPSEEIIRQLREVRDRQIAEAAGLDIN